MMKGSFMLNFRKMSEQHLKLSSKSVKVVYAEKVNFPITSHLLSEVKTKESKS